MSANVSALGDFIMTDEEKAAADKAEADRKTADQKAANDKAAADKTESDRKAAEDQAAEKKGDQRSEDGDRKAAEDLARVTGERDSVRTERDTLKGQVTSVTAEHDAAVKEQVGK